MKFGDGIKIPRGGMDKGGMVCGILKRCNNPRKRLLLVFCCSARNKSQKLVMEGGGSGKGL